ncbi:hypothetical protein GGP41_005027 [Bipolaris sorokiniana]|uniref:SPT2 chromatin protein n=2 Tax=Cochliobolus sativus TaxID=45130 RepID=A0A8H5ZJX5_COCSA|nr:hypothetical protein GGP41_005027 [Bipolaris sorokiniana]
MSSLKDIMSIIDPSARSAATASKQGPLGSAPKPAPRPVGGANGASQAPQLKRKASGPVENGQTKVQRKEAVGGIAQANGAVRATSSPATSRPSSSTPTTSVPYRGTAAPSSSKTANPPARKPLQSSNTPATTTKAPAPAPKPAPVATGPAPASNAAPKKGYLAMLQKAKEKDASKPVAPPIKHEPTKILTRKERLALKAEAGVKGKKPVAGLPSKPADPKADPSKEKKKVEVGYQGTARPARKPVEVGYKGTARPSSAPVTSSRNGTPAAKPKPNPTKGRYDGYADWDDLDDMDDDEEDYESDGSSAMEGGIWDVEEEEQLALKAAKKEDAEALAEENRLKKEKEERKKRLAAMAAKAKRKY